MDSIDKVKLPWALSDGRLVHVSSVGNGIGCGCTCPSCGAKLVARNEGKIRLPHFAHYNSPECEDALETAMHIMAKEIIEKEKRIFVPSASFTIRNFHHLHSEARFLEFDKVELEQPLGDFKPDAVCYKNGKPSLLVEITVTHGIDDEKREKIKKSGVSCVEVRLDKNRHVDYESIRTVLMDENERTTLEGDQGIFDDDSLSYTRAWVYNHVTSVLEQLAWQASNWKEVVWKKGEGYVNGCACKCYQNFHGNYYSFIEKCNICEYNLSNSSGKNVICVGGFKDLLRTLSEMLIYN